MCVWNKVYINNNGPSPWPSWPTSHSPSITVTKLSSSIICWIPDSFQIDIRSITSILHHFLYLSPTCALDEHHLPSLLCLEHPHTEKPHSGYITYTCIMASFTYIITSLTITSQWNWPLWVKFSLLFPLAWALTSRLSAMLLLESQRLTLQTNVVARAFTPSLTRSH